MHMQKVKVKGYSVKKIIMKTDRQTDGRTDGGDCITSRANAVSNSVDHLRVVHITVTHDFML